MVMTLEADYAVRIVEYLTKHPGRWDARTISEEMDVPQRFCLKSTGPWEVAFTATAQAASTGDRATRPRAENTMSKARFTCAYDLLGIRERGVRTSMPGCRRAAMRSPAESAGSSSRQKSSPGRAVSAAIAAAVSSS